MKIEDARKLVKRLVAVYPNWKPDKDTADIWVEEFMDTPDDRVEMNMKEWIKRGEKFMPSLAEMIRPNSRIEADKEIERTRKMLEEQEERIKNVVPSPWVQEGKTFKQWFQDLEKSKGK